MEASNARGGIGRASYEAVRKHIDDGKKATEAFKLVATQTDRSTATVQTAYYRIARSLPDGGGARSRPRKKAAAKRARRAVAPLTATTPSARRGRPPAARASSTDAGRQLVAAVETLVAHVARLEEELTTARKDSHRLADIARAIKR